MQRRINVAAATDCQAQISALWTVTEGVPIIRKNAGKDRAGLLAKPDSAPIKRDRSSSAR